MQIQNSRVGLPQAGSTELPVLPSDYLFRRSRAIKPPRLKQNQGTGFGNDGSHWIGFVVAGFKGDDEVG